jgi:hypothetical protein
MSSSRPLPPCEWCSSLAGPLPGSPPLFLDTVLARGRRTVTRSILTAGLNGQSPYCYTALAAAVKKAEAIDANLVLSVAEPISGRVGRLPLALYDRQTERYGPYVHGTVAYQNPTPGLTRSTYDFDVGALQIVSGSEAGIVTGNYSSRVFDLEKLVKDRS